ncbi:thiazole synthase [Marinicrinis sediminis]|uniref:Thiazole synthase n=1 Tax=Marinicrinis sediminis TaxID=1652465 RepID=A0ABW5R925_9BACL
MMDTRDTLLIGDTPITNRLWLGTGKYGHMQTMKDTLQAAQSQVITVAVRRAEWSETEDSILHHLPDNTILLPNTSGARNAEEAVRIARLAQAAGMGNWVKIEVIRDQKYLLPDNLETIRASERLVKEGFIVLPYMSPDLMAARQLEEAGAAAVMPLGAPIGSNRGLQMKELIQIMIMEARLPVIVDAGIGRPSDAGLAMEMGAAAVLVNTAIATARHPVLMAEAFHLAVQAGRKAHLAGLGPVSASAQAQASSPLTGFLGERS